ncbi:MAG: hypothetical protein ACK55I_32580, partial [bacterium]
LPVHTPHGPGTGRAPGREASLHLAAAAPCHGPRARPVRPRAGWRPRWAPVGGGWPRGPLAPHG